MFQTELTQVFRQTFRVNLPLIVFQLNYSESRASKVFHDVVY